MCGRVLVCPGVAEEPVLHDPSVHAGAGLKKELFAGITEADFLKLGSRPKSVKVTLVASLTDDNSGMNFNGYSHGRASYLIPSGWTVEVTLINPSPVPHSVILVDRDELRKTQMGTPAFGDASIPNPTTGISTSKATFSFTADTPGEYALACGIPNHAMGGHWVAFDVSATASRPSLKLGDAAAREAK
jgi:FtsP/CotA-like multicopper oxidase with cupredoxin domain